MFSRMKVHVLAHDERLRQAARSLSPKRFEVSYSSNRAEALSVISDMGCDLAIIELEGGGFGVARDLRADPRTKDARVVMVCDRPHDRWLCLQAGADEVLVKPLQDVMTLMKAIDSVLEVAKTDNQS